MGFIRLCLLFIVGHLHTLLILLLRLITKEDIWIYYPNMPTSRLNALLLEYYHDFNELDDRAFEFRKHFKVIVYHINKQLKTDKDINRFKKTNGFHTIEELSLVYGAEVALDWMRTRGVTIHDSEGFLRVHLYFLARQNRQYISDNDLDELSNIAITQFDTIKVFAAG